MAMDMSINKKSYDVQSKVRENAQEFGTSLGNFSDWQKNIKSKEQMLVEQRVPQVKEEEELYSKVRSHVYAHDKENKDVEEEQQQQPSQTTEKVAKGALATTPSVEKLDPNEEKRQRANVIKDLGNVHVKLQDYEQAIREYTRAIEVFPEDPVFYCNRALCYLKLENYNECIEDCDQAIQIDHSFVKAYYRRMQANESLGNNMDALKDCTSVLMLQPKNIEATKSLDRINERLRTTVRKPNGPNFTELRDNMLDILPYDKPAYKRSTKPLRRVPITEVILPKAESGNMKISDEDIDRLFNSNCGPFVEIKPSDKSEAKKPKLNDVPKVENKKVQKALAEPEDIKGLKLAKNMETLEALMKETEKVVDKMETASKTTVKVPKVESLSKTSSNAKPPYEAEWSEAPLEPLNLGNLQTSKGAEIQTKKDDEKSKEIQEEILSLPPTPTNSAEFYVNWKELTMSQKYQYLKRIPLENLLRILGAGLDSETFSDIITLLHDHYLPAKDPLLVKTLLEIGKHDQCCLLSMMMVGEERLALMEIVNTLKSTDADAVKVITNAFQLM